jgi:ligand-binding sensor domain-containing protein
MLAFNVMHGLFARTGLTRTTDYLSDKLNFSHLTRENGLPSNRIRCVVQDFQGYVWIGTDNGLVRFDGHNTTVFQHDKDNPASIIDNIINGIIQTSDSLLVIATLDGLSVYNPFAREFTNYSYFYKGSERFPVKGAACFYEDNDTLWIGGENGLILMKQNPVRFTLFTLRKSELKTNREYFFNHITCILQDPKDKCKLLISTLGGIVQFDKTNHTITHDYKKTINNNSYGIVGLYLEDKRYLWNCGWGFGLNCLDLKTGEWQEYPFNRQSPISIISILPKSPGEFWITTVDNGLGIFNKTDFSFKFYKTDPGDRKSLLSNTLNKSIFINDKKDLWITSDDGINILNLDVKKFQAIDIPFSNYFVRAFYSDKKQQHLYVGAIDSEGLFDWDVRKKVWNIILPEEPAGKNSLGIFTIYEDSRSVIWLGTRSNLMYVDSRSNRLKIFRTPDGKQLPLEDKRIYSIMEDDKGNLWIGTRSEGVIKIDSSRTGFTHYQNNPADPYSLIDGRWMGSFCLDRHNRIWIGCDKGLSIFEPDKNRFRNDIMDSILKSGITKQWINGIEMDTLGRMWVLIDVGGLLRIEETKDTRFSFKLFNTTNGLNNPSMGRMAKDPYGGLWMINYGLLHLNPYDESIHFFDEHNGLNSSLNYSESIYIDQDGNIYLTNADKFETKNIRDLDFSPLTIKLLLESVEVNGNNIAFEKLVNTEQALKLNADQNNFLFRYTGICFHEVEQIRFKYMLEGFDHEWIIAGTVREVRYTNLPPGDYIFKVKVSGRGIWLDQETSLHIVIRPFFWKTWWFISLSVLIIITLSFLAYQYRVSQIIKIERLRRRIATDLHDEVSSTLSSISILSDILGGQTENGRAAKMVAEIGLGARTMLERIDDIIWIVNPKNDNFRDLGLRIREFSIPLFESKNIAFQISYDAELAKRSIPIEIRRNVYLIAKEAINNLIKYSQCSNASIVIRQQIPNLVMEITDDGTGFNPDAETTRNGLQNMHQRAAQIKADLDIISSLGHGTSITLLFKII